MQIEKLDLGNGKQMVNPRRMLPGETCANENWNGTMFWMKTDNGTLVSLRDGSTYTYSENEKDFYRVSIEEAVAKF